MEVSKNEKNKQLFNVCCEEAYTPDVLKISFFFHSYCFSHSISYRSLRLPFCTQSHNTEWPKSTTLQRRTLRKRRLREFKQRRRRRLRKRHLKNEFALPQTLPRLFHLV